MRSTSGRQGGPPPLLLYYRSIFGGLASHRRQAELPGIVGGTDGWRPGVSDWHDSQNRAYVPVPKGPEPAFQITDGAKEFYVRF